MHEKNDTVRLEPRWFGSKLDVTARWNGDVVHRDTINPASANSRQRFINALVEKLPAAKPDETDAKLLQIADTMEAQSDALHAGSRNELLAAFDKQTTEALQSMPQTTIAEAESLVCDPYLIDRILDDCEACGVVGERELALTTYIIGTSRLLGKPLSGIVQGPSSSGKSFVIEMVARLFPDEAVIRATDMTAQALYYLPTGSLTHRFVVAGERSRIQDDQRAEATRALREMLSSGELTKIVTMSPNRKQEAVRIWQPGPIAYIESTTSASIFDEDANRSWLLATDESTDQTRAIVAATARQAEGQARNVGPLIAKHHAMQRLLRRVHVTIPYAQQLASAMPMERPQARRAIAQIFDTIRAVTTLHQRQRVEGTIGHGETIRATAADFVIARRLLSGPLSRALGGALTPAVANFGKRVRARYGDQTFSSTRAAQEDAILGSKGKVNEYLRALSEVGAAECVQEHQGNKPAEWKMTGVMPVNGALWLPPVNKIQGKADDQERKQKLVRA